MTTVPDLEIQKLQLEKARQRNELWKWVIAALGAIVSFLVIDYGKLRLERHRFEAESRRQVLTAYIEATEAPEPEIWKRKLHILETFSGDENTTRWAREQLEYIQRYAALDTLYRETLQVAAQLTERSALGSPERARARARFNQLYWADLPFAGETQPVVQAMIAFRTKLMEAEAAPEDQAAWDELNAALISLSNVLRSETPAQKVEER